MRERLKAQPSPLMSRYLIVPTLEADAKRSFGNMSRLNLAHVLMLESQGIITREAARVLCRVLLDIDAKGVAAIELDPSLEDLYFNVERAVIAQAGDEIGGQMHTARSRNDLGATLSRMNVRDRTLDLLPRLLRLRALLTELAEEYAATVVTGYTHMQPAQPITFGHYFSAVAQALARDFDRLCQAYARLNCSPLGGCAFAGTSFPIDRGLTADLLGFDATLVNTIDGVVSRDYLCELTADFATLGCTISRLAVDLYTWATDEFSYVEVDDSLAVCSSIMPQKKNSVTLEHLRSMSAHLAGAFVSVFAALKSAPYGHCHDVSAEAPHLFWDAADGLEAMLELAWATLRTLTIKAEHAAARVDKNFCTVTELADLMVRSEGLSFRQAHRVVGYVVGDALDAGLDATSITAATLCAASERILGRSLSLSEEQVARARSAEHSAATRICEGGCAPEPMAALCAQLSTALAADEERLNELKRRQSAALERLYALAQELAAPLF